MAAGAPSRAALVYNPTKAPAAKVRGRLSRMSKKAGWGAPLFFETTPDDAGQGAARAALDAGADAVLVAGGDGTVRAVAEAMHSTGVPLAIVPSGTGNLLARNLRLPLDDPDAMIQAVFDGDTMPTDIGVAQVTRADGTVEEHAFVVMAGIGLDAAMIANTNPRLKKTMGWVAYVDGAARSLPSAQPFRVVYQLDGKRLHSATVQSVLFANCGQLPGGIALIPDASVADGHLDACVIKPAGVLGWARVWRRIWWDNSLLQRTRLGRKALQRRRPDGSVRYLRGKVIEAATAPARHVELDGDEFGEATRIRCEVVAGGLIAVVPRGHDTSRL